MLFLTLTPSVDKFCATWLDLPKNCVFLDAVLFKILPMFKRLIFVFKPVLTWIFLNNPERVSRAVAASAQRSLSGMVSAFNFWHHVIFESFFERVKVHEADIQTIRGLSGPIVFVLKNRGSLEYRYFNHLFLKEKLPLVHYANKCFTLHWWPWRAPWQTVIFELKNLFDKGSPEPTDHAK